MSSAYEKLDKILRAEQSRGCENEVVIGGLEEFVRRWREEALAESSDQAQQQKVTEIAGALADYGSLAPERRAEIINEVLATIAGDPESQQEPRRPPPLQKPGSAPTRSAPAAQRVERPPAVAPPSPITRPASGLEAPVDSLPGVSTAFTSRLNRLGIATVGDLLRHFPHRYDDYSKLKPINQ
ncbi:MAG TPA: hypothetical protein ENO23_10095, partial [Alphaproteobacteria bacterium]|nr:hypothetical protein [Alphaproteobacteria bacterium]